MIASVVLAAAAVGIAGTLSASYQQTSALEQRATAVSLARQLMEEIIARPFDDPSAGVNAMGPETAEISNDGSAANFDNIDDYDGYGDVSTPASATPVAQVAQSGLGAAAASPGSYTRNVEVEYRATVDGPASNSGPFAVVRVQVTTPAGLVVSLAELTCDYTRGK